MITRFQIFENVVNQKEFFENPPWQPLYNFLEPIFDKNYKEAADQWMYMNSSICEECEGGMLHFYKNGITRKYLVLDEKGDPWTVVKWLSENEWGSGKFSVVSAKKIPIGEAFKNAYQDIEKFARFDDGQKSPYFVKYNSEYKCNLYKALTDAGYNVIGINNSDTAEEIMQKLKDSGIGCREE